MLSLLKAKAKVKSLIFELKDMKPEEVLLIYQDRQQEVRDILYKCYGNDRDIIKKINYSKFPLLLSYAVKYNLLEGEPEKMMLVFKDYRDQLISQILEHYDWAHYNKEDLNELELDVLVAMALRLKEVNKTIRQKPDDTTGRTGYVLINTENEDYFLK